MWIYLGICSAVFLGLYDVSKKHGVHGNAVLPVMFSATSTGALLVGCAVIASRLTPEIMTACRLFVPPLSLNAHLVIAIKAAIVSVSWICAYFSLKHLPISIDAPIRAGGPVWILVGAVLLFGERPTIAQWVGLGIILVSYYAFSVLGRGEGIEFRRDKWIGFALLATLTGAISSLYDKFLLQNCGLKPMAVLAWFSLYMVPFQGAVLVLFWWPRRMKHTLFQWRWSIPMIGFLLVVADYLYFSALSDDRALISLLGAIRRTSVVVSFLGGGLLFQEINLRKKGWALAGVLIGVFIIMYAS